MMKSENNCKIGTPLLGKIKLCSELGPFLSDNRIKLLAAIHQSGSLSAGARALPLSYKAAWDAIDSMNNLADEPVALRTTEEGNKGNTQLTPYALRLIAIYKALELEYQTAFESLKTAIVNSSESSCDHEVSRFRQLMRHMNFRSSARNQLIGTVKSIVPGKVNSLVSLTISRQLNITAMVSCESVDELNLTIGSEVLLLIKASQITVSQKPLPASDLTNQFTGKLMQMRSGAVYSHLYIELTGQKNLCAIVANETLNTLQLQNKIPLTLSFFASSVTLCCYH